jgi:large subunit ribosomal protein L35
MQATRREFLIAAAGLAASQAATAQDYPIIDIHQHTPYSGRTADQLVAHQRTMGIGKTVLLPAGRRYGLAAEAGGNDVVVELAKRYPKEYVFFAKGSKMPKMKTKSAAKKRFKITGTGKVKSAAAGKRHGMIKRSNKFIRDARGTMVLAEPDGKKVIKNFLPNGGGI